MAGAPRSGMVGAGLVVGRLVGAGVGAALARGFLNAVRSAPLGHKLDRVNYRGRTVSLAAGPALALAASVAAAAGAGAEGDRGLAASSLVAGLGAGAVGRYDDVVGVVRPDERLAKGFSGHLRALRHGRVTGGLVKIVGVGAAGLAASVLLPARRRSRPGRVIDAALAAGVIAGTANLVNLLDLRPGRALKAGIGLGLPLAATTVGGAVAGPLGAAGALLRDDLDEEVMLGDCGANALGAILGVALAARCGTLARGTLLAGLAALTAASEKVSFTEVIDATPGLRELDRLGRRV